MNIRRLSLVALFLLITSTQAQESPPAMSAEARKELAALQGTWQLESIQSGKKDKVDVKNRTLFIGADVFIQRDGERMVQIGNVRLVPNRTPRRMDVVVRKGLHEDSTMLGIYELKGDTLKVCFDPDGDSRPDKFATKDETPRFVAVYKRARAEGEGINIIGKYLSVSADENGRKKKVPVEIEKRGDTYFLKWMLDGKIAFVGSGIRQGNTLSVAYINPGNAGLAVYKIEKGPRLVGSYTDIAGAGLLVHDEMHPDTKDEVEVEVRLRR